MGLKYIDDFVQLRPGRERKIIMTRWIIFRAWAILVFLAVGVVVTSLGCVSVEAPKDIRVDISDYYQRHERKDDYREEARHERRKDRKKHREGKLKKDEAYDIAKDLASDEGINTDRFKIKDKKIGRVYWVLFERERQGPRGRWRNHFAVRLARGHRGKTRVILYKGVGRKDFSGDMDEDKVEKDEAYKYAKAMARNYGARPRHYEIHDKKINNNYWVLFEHKNPKRGRDWKNHFAVRVSKYGVGTFYK